MIIPKVYNYLNHVPFYLPLEMLDMFEDVKLAFGKGDICKHKYSWVSTLSLTRIESYLPKSMSFITPWIPFHVDEEPAIFRRLEHAVS